MVPFTTGLATGCLIGVCGTLLLLSLVSVFSEKRPQALTEFSIWKLGCGAGTLIVIASVSYLLRLNAAASMLLLFIAVLAIARFAGLATGIVASVLAAGMLSYFFLPPVGSLKVLYPGDRLILALFLLSAILGSRLVRYPVQGSHRHS